MVVRVRVCNLLGCREALKHLFILRSPCQPPSIVFVGVARNQVTVSFVFFGFLWLVFMCVM